MNNRQTISIGDAYHRLLRRAYPSKKDIQPGWKRLRVNARRIKG